MTGYIFHLIGVIFDHTSSFLGVFYMNSALYLMASLLYGFIIYLNKSKPKWCFPEDGEKLSLVENMKGPKTTDNRDVCSVMQTDNPMFMGTASVQDSSSDSTEAENSGVD